MVNNFLAITVSYLFKDHDLKAIYFMDEQRNLFHVKSIFLSNFLGIKLSAFQPSHSKVSINLSPSIEILSRLMPNVLPSILIRIYDSIILIYSDT